MERFSRNRALGTKKSVRQRAEHVWVGVPKIKETIERWSMWKCKRLWVTLAEVKEALLSLVVCLEFF